MPRMHIEYRWLNGYRLIYEPNYPKSMKSGGHEGFVYEHVYVAEKMLGRELRPNEVVHHLDGNKGNNKRRNLLVIEDSQHAKIHRWLERGAPYSAHTEIPLGQGSPDIVQYCPSCGRTVQGKGKYCKLCWGVARRKAERPSKDQMRKDIELLNWRAIGKKYGVSDNAARKWARQYGLIV